MDEIAGHTYLFLKEQLENFTMPAPSTILHGTIIGTHRNNTFLFNSNPYSLGIIKLKVNVHCFVNVYSCHNDTTYSVLFEALYVIEPV